MERAPKVSILITSYNREKTLGASIESALASALGDIEVLVVDNRSTDGSVDLAREYARRDRRVRVVVNETNLGQFGNRNRAAELARAPYLKYQDSDDLMYPHCLPVMVPLLDAEPRAGFALSSNRAWEGGPCPMLLSPRMCFQREFLGPGLFNLGPSCALFRAEAFRALGGFPLQGSGSDYLFWLRACAEVSVLLVPADLFWYRLHPGQELQDSSAQLDYAILFGEAWRALHADGCPLSSEEREAARRNLVYLIAKDTLLKARSGQWGFAKRQLRCAGLSLRDWAVYLRRPRRQRLMGNPLDENGDYLVSAWPSLSASSSEKAGAEPRSREAFP